MQSTALRVTRWWLFYLPTCYFKFDQQSHESLAASFCRELSRQQADHITSKPGRHSEFPVPGPATAFYQGPRVQMLKQCQLSRTSVQHGTATNLRGANRWNTWCFHFYFAHHLRRWKFRGWSHMHTGNVQICFQTPILAPLALSEISRNTSMRVGSQIVSNTYVYFVSANLLWKHIFCPPTRKCQHRS